MTEENKDEIETVENPQSAADEPASETVKAQLQDTAPGIARDAEAAVAFPAQVTAALEYAAANQYEYGPRLHDVELTWDVVSAEAAEVEHSRRHREHQASHHRSSAANVISQEIGQPGQSCAK